VLAGATQLAQYTLQISAAISEIHERVRGGTELRKHAAQLQQLVDTTVEIKRNPRAYNPSVLRHLTSATDEAKAVLDLLQQLSADYTHGSIGRRYYKAATGSKNEKKIVAGFRRLEQEKTSLIFCIGMGNTEQLHSIQNGVTKLTRDTGLFDLSETVYMSSIQGQDVEVIPRACSQGHRELIPKGEYALCCLKCGDIIAAVPRLPLAKDNGVGQSSSNSTVDRSYEGCHVVGAATNARQQNGNIGTVTGNSKYTNCTVTGNGSQLNGSVSGDQALAIVAKFWDK